jgi:hypothetical protein
MAQSEHSGMIVAKTETSGDRSGNSSAGSRFQPKFLCRALSHAIPTATPCLTSLEMQPSCCQCQISQMQPGMSKRRAAKMNPNRLQEMLGLASAAAAFCDRTIHAVSALRELLNRAKPKRDPEVTETLKKLDADLLATAVVHARLSAKLTSLNEEISRNEEFEKERSRYELVETSEGDFVFRIKNNMADEQPIHYICPVCVNRDKTISFIAGRNRKVCQTDRKHVFNFGKTAPVLTPKVRH